MTHTTGNQARTNPIGKGLNMRITLNWETITWALLLILAIISRFADLGVRAMSHDESLHTYFSYNLAMGRGFAHTPMMHGPLLFHMTALNYLLFGADDFTSRIYPAFLGVLIVLSPLLMRRFLGKKGAVATGVLILISPMLLYYSRYIRHDIPAITAAIIMMLAIFFYMEERQYKYLLLLAFGQAFLFASKEVSFIYVAIFGLFLVIFFFTRVFRVPWRHEKNKRAFLIALALLMILVAAFVALNVIDARSGVPEDPALADGAEAEGLPAAGLPEDIDPAGVLPETAPAVIENPVWELPLLGGILLLLASLVFFLIRGLGQDLRHFAELDVAMVLGTLILPHLTPFLIHFLGRNPSSELPADINFTAILTAVMLFLSVFIGMLYFMRPSREKVRFIQDDEGNEQAVILKPSFSDQMSAFFSSRWLFIGALYWAFTLFFFTTMFTNGNGLGTGIVGSLSYWLEQQEVERGGQPFFYYFLVQIPLYEFLPAILSLSAGVGGILAGLKMGRKNIEANSDAEDEPLPVRQPLDLEAPARFPMIEFIGFLAIMNLIAYSLAGEKMPWLTTHLTFPMILLGGFAIGWALDHFNWRRLFMGKRMIALLLLPVALLALARVLGPVCIAMPAMPFCNTVIPSSYQVAVFSDLTTQSLSATGGFIGALIVLIGAFVFMILFGEGIRFKDWMAIFAALMVLSLGLLTARSAYRAAFINYDEATEFLVYAHSSDTTNLVLSDIEELSQKLSGEGEFKVAYDDKVSWPMSWYMRHYPGAVYFGQEPTRQLLDNATVILAGWGNNTKVESLIGDRYYRFTYVRMWWPIEDYRNTTWQTFRDIARDPALQRGLWKIFIDRDYEAYADAVTPYRNGTRPDYSLSNWPVSDRIYVYIRKDAFAQVWNYGVTASEIAATLDPYAENSLELLPSNTFGEGLLSQPHGIAVAPGGAFAVADTQNHSIALFSAAGEFQEVVGSFGYAPETSVLNEPWDVAFGEEGEIFVADTWNFRVMVFDPTGEFLRTWGEEGPNQLTNSYALWGPRGITTDDQGRIYLSDTGNKRVLVFTPEGEFIRQIGMGGAFEGQLDEPAGLAVGPDGNLYIADTWNQRVSVFTADGIFLRSWQVDAWFGQSNERPYIAVDPQNRVFISDPGGYRIIAFSSEGQYLFSFGDYGMLKSPAGLAFNEEGDLFIVDTEAGLVHLFDSFLLQPAPGD